LRDPAGTRRAILDAAEALVYEQGFAASSIDTVIDRAGVTKGAFFHHFKSKAALGLALVQRFAQRDAKILDHFITRVEKLSRDPVQQVLLFAAVFEDELSELGGPHPGCMFATFCFEAGLFDETTRDVIAEGFRTWRDRLAEKFAAAIAARPPSIEVDPKQLADMATAMFEGGLVLSKGLGEPRVHIEQMRQYRNYIELLFAPPAAPRSRRAGRAEGAPKRPSRVKARSPLPTG